MAPTTTSAPERAQLAGALIHHFDGLRLTAYQDTGGVWTLGWGHTGGVKEGDTCTVDQAAAWLAEDAAPLFAVVEAQPAAAAGAWVSFGYNCGRHTLELAVAGKVDMRRFIHDRHGHELAGLKTRREIEYAIIRAATAPPQLPLSSA